MKIDKIEFSRDITIRPIADRWYRIDGAFTVDIYLKDEGVVHIRVDDGFMFDGRSGGPCVDFIAPNLGTQDELKIWLLHDLMGYDIYFSFKETNKIQVYLCIKNFVYLQINHLMLTHLHYF